MAKQTVRLPDGSTIQLGKKAAKAYALAAQQQQLNQQTAQFQQGLNMTNQVTPQGGITYTQTPGTQPGQPGSYTATQTLSPQEQALYNQDAALRQQMGEVAGNQLGAVSDTLSSPLDLGEFNAQTAKGNTLYDLQSKYLDRDFARQDAALEQKLANQGIFPGMEAYDRAHQQQAENQAYARNNLLVQGDQQAFNQAMQGRQLSNTEMLTERNQPLQELNAFRTGSQVSQPNFVSTPQAGVANADMLGTYGTLYQADKAAQAARTGAIYGALGSAAGAAGNAVGSYYGASDERLKENIVDEGPIGGGLNAFSYNFKGSPQRQTGLLAQQVEQIVPEAVTEGPDGMKAVNYGLIAQLLGGFR